MLRGLRRGEAAGLRWCDIDLEADIAVINSQSHNIGGKIVQAPPKTKASRHTIALDHTTVAALRRHRHRQRAELSALNAEDSGYVFTNVDGRPISPDRLSINFGKLIAASGLPPVRLHDLRHGAAGLALQAGRRRPEGGSVSTVPRTTPSATPSRIGSRRASKTAIP